MGGHKLFLILVITFLLVAAVGYFVNPQPLSPVAEPTSPTPAETQLSEAPAVEIDGQIYAYRLFETEKPDAIALIPNYSQKLTVNELVEMHGCRSAINAGFYDPDRRPLGLVTANGQNLAPPRKSSLLNGFFFITDTGVVGIADELPGANLTLGLQSGPLLVTEGSSVPLSLVTDEPARRSVLAITANSRLLAIIVYRKEAVFAGPLLSLLPEIVMAIAQKEGQTISAAVNLDGGSASAYHSTDASLDELTPVGGLFCIR